MTAAHSRERGPLAEAWLDDFGDPDGGTLDPAISQLLRDVLAHNVLLRSVVAQAVDALVAEHVPFRYDGKRVTDDNAVGCRACYPGDGSWPCATRSVADDLAAALSGR